MYRSVFSVIATEEQISYTKKIVDYSMKNHKISNIWDKDKNKKDNTEFYRFIGSLGEVVFADTYGLKRHEKSFGAVDGQDYGNDFDTEIDGKRYIIDLKSMHRKNDIFYGNYVLNIPASQLHKVQSVTGLYCAISIHEDTVKKTWHISFIGFGKKDDIIKKKIGIFYKAGTVRTRGDGTTFTFLEDTYEIDFKDFTAPLITNKIEQLYGFKTIKIK